MATVYIGGASIDEHGKAHGGQAGNQTGKELKKQKWYLHSKGWRVFRAKSAEAQAKLAACMAAAVANKHIGYDQYQRNTLYKAAEPFGFDVSKVTADVECDCSALVRVCCAYAGITGLPEGFRTTNEPKNLLGTGAFMEMVGEKYTKQAAYLKAGDILCTPVQGHTVIVLNDGDKAEPTAEGLRRGDYGTAVTAMQKLLLKWDKACLPKCGADGDFGGETERAVKDFQNTHDLPVTGVYDEKTRRLLTGMYGEPATQQSERPEGAEAPAHGLSGAETRDPAQAEGAGRSVEITGGTVNVRSAPGTKGKDIGDVHRGERYPYGGLTAEVDGRDWYLIDWHNTNGWVSGKFARLV